MLASWERDNDDKAFTDYRDISATNQGKHASAREDTFKTPSSLHQKFKTPLSKDKRYGLGDSRDLQAICEQGFNKCMHRISAQLLQEVRAELAEPMESVHTQFAESHERDLNMETALGTVIEQVRLLHEDVRSPVDFSPVLNNLQENESSLLQTQNSLMQHIEGRLSQDVSQVLGALHEVQQKQNELEKGLREEMREVLQDRSALDELSKQCRDQLSAILEMQQSLREECSANAQEIQRMHEQNIEHHTGTASLIEDKLSTHTRNLPHNFERVIHQVRATQEVLNADTRIVLTELAKIQQALNVDFAHVLDEMHQGIAQIGEHASGLIEDHTSPTSLQAEALPQMPVMLGDEEPSENTPGLHVRVTKKRFREYYTQTDMKQSQEQTSQTDDTLLKATLEKAKKKELLLSKTKKEKVLAGHGFRNIVEKKNKAMFADKEELKKRMRAQLLKKQYNVVDHYHRYGCAQAIATNWIFEMLTLFVIIMNALWIAVDTDHNDAEMLIDAEPVFVIVENCFCTFFAIELTIRFLAFNGKMYAFRDFWFIFDSILVFLMIVETWIIPGVMLAVGIRGVSGTGNASILRITRMVRMLRVGRMARLMRSIPELVILIKGIRAASRSVIVFFLLWTMIIYIFAIVFKQITDGNAVGDKYFDSVPDAMNTLLLDGILPDASPLVNGVSEENWLYWPILMVFIMLASVTVMYMLVGVLVEVVGVIAAAEKEGMMVTSIATDLRVAMAQVGYNPDAPITQFEFNKCLETPQVAGIMHGAEVDVLMLSEMSDVIFENPDMEATGLTFEMFVEIVLNMRGSNFATVKDLKEQIRVMKRLVSMSSENMFNNIKEEFNQLYEQIWELRQADLEELEAKTEVKDDEGSPRRFNRAASSRTQVSYISGKGRTLNYIDDDDDEDD